VEELPTLLHFALFRCWAPAYPQPKRLLALLADPPSSARLRKAAQLLWFV